MLVQSPYERVDVAAHEHGVSRVEALEDIRELMLITVNTAVKSARLGGVEVPMSDEIAGMIYAASTLGGLRMALALADADMTEDEVEHYMKCSTYLYREMMSDELMRMCAAGDAADPISQPQEAKQ